PASRNSASSASGSRKSSRDSPSSNRTSGSATTRIVATSTSRAALFGRQWMKGNSTKDVGCPTSSSWRRLKWWKRGAESARLLLRNAVERAEAPHQIRAANAHDFPLREEFLEDPH